MQTTTTYRCTCNSGYVRCSQPVPHRGMECAACSTRKTYPEGHNDGYHGKQLRHFPTPTSGIV